MPRTCGQCVNHRPDTQECALSLSYAAFVRADAPANGCIGYLDKQRAEAERQSECRPSTGSGTGAPAVTLPALFAQFQAQQVKP